MSPGGPERSHAVAWRDLMTAALLFALALAYISLSSNRTFVPSDEGMILYHSARVAAGEVPYEDFSDTYGPGVFVVTGLVLRAFDERILAVHLLIACFKALAVALTYLIARGVVTAPFAVFGAVIAVAYWGRLAWNLNTPYAALYTIPLCLLACFALICAQRRESRLGYLLAGLIGGGAILFKQTLGGVNAFGMVVAVSAVTALAGPPAERTRAGAVQFLAVWLLAGLALVLPGFHLLRPTDYLLHFLALHVFMAVVAVVVIVRGCCNPLLPEVPRRFAPLVLGLSILPGLTALFYAWRNGLGVLAFNVLTLPTMLINYYMGLPLPPLGRCLLFLGIGGLLSTMLLALRGRWSGARMLGASALILVCVGAAIHSSDELSTVLGPARRLPDDSQWPVILWTIPSMLESLLSPAVLFAATVVLLPAILTPQREVPATVLQTLLPLALFQASLTFQVFPRGYTNVWLAQGAVAPLLAIVLYWWYRLGVSRSANIARRVGAGLLVSVVPLWMIAPIVHDLFSSIWVPGDTALTLPQTRGITLNPRDLRMSHASEMESLVAFLGALESPDSPVLPISIDTMMLYLSGRPHLFPKIDYYFFLLGLDMLPPAQRAELADESLLQRLAEVPDALIVIRNDRMGMRILFTLVKLRDAIARDYETVAKFGSYYVLRRRSETVAGPALAP
jgi:hypothetical protein